MIKRLISVISAFVLVILPLTTYAVTGPNLVNNHSAEDLTADGNPVDWFTGNWGSNDSNNQVSNDAHSGANSLSTRITNYSSGDAKWFFAPVTVTPGQTYAYSDFYKSDVETKVVIAFWSDYTPGADADQYDFSLPNAPGQADWTQYSGTFTVPANMTKVSVYHLIDQVGTLTIDTVSLVHVLEAEPPVTSSSLILNPSLENADPANPSKPANWYAGNWGSNTPTYEWVNEGRTGNKSVRVTVSNYVDGDAKWMFNALSTGSNPGQLERGKQYRFTAWYKTNTIPNAVVHFVRDNGTDAYYGMPNPQPQSNAENVWQKYSDTFTVPVDVKSVDVFFYVNTNGWVQTDDYSIEPYSPIGFAQPLVTLTFDDGHEDNITNALPLLNQYGFKTTQCYATQHVEGVPSAIAGVKAFYNSGHEICSHTVSHPDLRTLSETQLRYELSHSKEVLESIIGEPVKNFASPYGGYNAYVNTVINDYYQSHRTVDEGFNSKDNFDVYRLRVQNVQNTTTLAEFQSWLEQAKATNTWLILVYHRVADDAGQFDSYPTDFAAQLEAIKQSGLTVKTFQDALTDVWAQLGISEPEEPTQPIIPGDINTDGKVDEDDATILFANWGDHGQTTNVPGDLDHNGSVDDDDATILFANWSF